MLKKKERKETDFVVELNSINPVVILQPEATAGMREYSNLEEVPGWAPWDHHIQKIAGEIRDPNRFIHVGNLVLAGSTSNGKQEVRSYDGCGESIEFVDQGQLRFICSRCQTNAWFRGRTREELPNLFLHLLLKQVVPDLPTCNYIHLENGIGGELGTIAIAGDELGINPQGGTGTMASLGFTLMPGMRTLHNLGQFEEWLKALLAIKYQQLEAAAKSLLPELLGPKPHRRGGIYDTRYWRYQ